MNPDSSTISKSVSGASSSSNAVSFSVETMKGIEKFFPLFDAMSQKVHLPNILYFLAMLYSCYQTVVTSCWITSNKLVFKENAELFANISDYAFFRGSYTLSSQYSTPFLVIGLLFSFTILLLLVEFRFFISNRRFIVWLLYPLRFLIEITPLFVLYPISNMLGFLYLKVRDGQNTNTELAFFISLIVFYFIIAKIYSVTNSHFSISAYIEDHFLSIDDYYPLSLLIIINPLFRALSIGSSANSEWTPYFISFVHLIFFGYLYQRWRFFPFYSKTTNILYLVVTSTSIGLDIAMLAFYFLKSSNGYLMFYIALVIFVVSTVVFFIYNGSVTKKITLELSYPKDNNEQGSEIRQLSDEEKNDLIEKLCLEKNIYRLFMYMRVGLSECCDLFTDFSLLKHILQKSDDTRVLCFCMRLLTFFPSEDRFLNRIFSLIARIRDLSYRNKFMLYQVQRIKILRQSSSSTNSALEKLTKMKQLTKQCENDVKGFWKNDNYGTAFFEYIGNSTNGLKALWRELLEDYPNSITHHEEYCRFLIECTTDIQEAVVMKYKIGLLETGSNFAVDYCFRSMVRLFPQYLKRKIMDVRGNMILKKVQKKGSHNQSGNSNSVDSLSSLTDIDFRLEEELGKSLVSQAKMRLALQYSTNGFRANYSSPLMVISLFILIFCISTVSVVYLILNSFFDGRYTDTERSSMISTLHTSFTLCSLYTLLFWGNSSNLVSYDKFNQILYKNTSSHVFSASPNNNFRSAVVYYNLDTRAFYRLFIQSVSKLAATENVNVYELTGVLIDSVVPVVYCTNGVPTPPEYLDLKTMLAYEYMAESLLVGRTNFDEWWTTEELFCTLFSTYPNIIDAFITLRNRLDIYQQGKSTSISNTIKQAELLLPVGFFFVAFIPPLVFIFFFNSEIKGLLKMMINIDKPSKTLAEAAISKRSDEINEDQFHSENIVSSNCFICSGVILFFTFICFVMAIFVFILSETISLNDQFYINSQWSYYSSIRSSLIADSVLYINLLAFIHHPIRSQTNATNVTFLNNMIAKYLVGINNMKETLLMGSSTVKSIIGHDSVIDSLSIQEQCKTPDNADLHDIYECSSTNQQLSMFINMVGEIQKKVVSLNGSANDFSMANMYHLALEHLIPSVQKMDKRLISLMSENVDYFGSLVNYMLITGIIISIVVFLILIQIKKKLDEAHRSALMILRRVPPSGIVNNQELVDYLIGRSINKNKANMSITSSVFHKTTDGIVCVSLSGVIEEINNSVSRILGSTPEQLLGQSIRSIFFDEDSTKVTNQMQLMANKQSANTFEGHMQCINDSEQTVHCKVSIHGMTLSSNKEIESFVIIIRDETQLIEQQESAELAKKNSETLLFQILPRDIIIRLNQGEKDISFIVPHASIMFIDIVKFSEYSSNLSPQEILGNLSLLFGAFDEALQKYPLMTKIKLIGDVYMCAAGLFATDDNPASHATEIVRFALECLQKLDDVNLKLNASLSVRIGVNTGGPIIAGVLGTDKPVFDIIGDPINIASRLQSTCIPSHIQISQSTYDLIQNLDFNIEQRGEIFLKGKGKSMAYLVKPQNFMVHFSYISTNGEVPSSK